MKSAEAILYIEITVECPYCEDIFDILKTTEEPEDATPIFQEVIEGDFFGTKKLDEIITCPDCHTRFKVDVVNW